MGESGGFLSHERESIHYRPLERRVRDWNEVYAAAADGTIQTQAARCMDVASRSVTADVRSGT